MAEKRPKKKAASPGGGGGGGGGASSGSPMDVGLLEQIVRLMAANDLNTVDVRDGNQRIVLKRGQPVLPFAAGGFAAPMMGMAAPPPAAAPSPGPSGRSGASDGPAGGSGSSAGSWIIRRRPTSARSRRCSGC